jgi:hypothetical protein
MNSQGNLDVKAGYTPKVKPPFKFDPDYYYKSTFVMGNKRPQYTPTNFIGRKTLRPDNLAPVRTYNPAGISGKYEFKGVVMRTLPVQPKFQ